MAIGRVRQEAAIDTWIGERSGVTSGEGGLYRRLDRGTLQGHRYHAIAS